MNTAYHRAFRVTLHLWLIVQLTGINSFVYPTTHLQPANISCSGCNPGTPDRLYIIQSIESQVVFNLRSLAALRITGIARNPQGRIIHNPSRPQASRVNVLLKTNEIIMSNPLYSKIVKGRNFLDVEHYPEISFVSERIEIDEKDKMRIHGIMTIRGISRDEILVAQLSENDANDDIIKFSATTTISRSDYGITSLKFLLSNTIDLQIEVTGVRSPADLSHGQ
jgi:polyisoprenoid-binding protein YceI